MLPAHLADNIRKQVLFYLQSTFDFRDREVEAAFERFLNDPETGLFKGPWVQLRRPFRLAEADETVPFAFAVPFHPFKHQNRAWRRLSSQDQAPRATIVTTGTGSGKTECFLYPILDHCLRARRQGQAGIKALILYPMNALATDQERRFARVIRQTPELQAAGIRVGNYTGRYDPAEPGAGADSGTTAMGADHGISHHATQQESPPDILLTNYKMLDYLLLRPQDQRLWRFNHDQPGVLRYLVLDELHTYDGAQGADVACLIRRLKERLDLPKGDLCVVGTSATLDDREPPKDRGNGAGDGAIDASDTSVDRLARFASTLFEEDIQADAVIGEDRLTVEEIIAPDLKDVTLPAAADCDPLGEEDALQYAQRQAGLWGGPVYATLDGAEAAQIDAAIEQWAVDLGRWLKCLRLFKALLDLFQQQESSGAEPLTWRHVVERLARADLSFNDVPQPEDRSRICASFFALIAYAKEVRSGTAFPLVPTQVQLWIRELRRLGRVVSDPPAFSWLDEPIPDAPSLPTFHCSECGESGWMALHDPSEDTRIGAQGVSGFKLDGNPARIYQGWFGFKGVRRSPHVVVISPWRAADDERERSAGAQTAFRFTQAYLCPRHLVIRDDDGPCPLSGDVKRFRVKLNRGTRRDDQSGATIGDQGCPHCGLTEGLLFIGSQSATLSSVAIDELFGSTLNTNPKLLAFTDSVQDASHRAGFFTARTYQFTFRTALQHVIDAAGTDGVRLSHAGRALLSWWAEPRSGWPGHMRQAMASLMPPDLREYAAFLTYRNQAAANLPPKTLQADIETRLTWEATREFGFMQTHGRTLERAASVCLGWDRTRIADTVARLRQRLPGIDPALLDLSDAHLTLWIYGLLHRYRLRGALSHPYLVDYARYGYWGKSPFGRTIAGREIYPPAGHYRPRLMVTRSQRDHEHVLAPMRGNRPPWHLVWTWRVFNKAVDETSWLDLIQHLLLTGTETGLFVKLHQDGAKQMYAIAAGAAILYADRVHLACSQSQRSLVRPPDEARCWEGAPSLEYDAHGGVYQLAEDTPRQRYYQDRYRKGTLRRVVASEHTGLLATDAREALETTFARHAHADDPNVLTCTSTLEMGINIGDLSSTMLCSIPPNTASYLQRIGRAGRETGTALIVSVINQRPHDLFFYGRPAEMLRGRVDPPGCWLDASAVLVRQFLAYAFDMATHHGALSQLPRSGRQLVEDLNREDGHLPRMMAWVTQREDELRHHFLRRFEAHIQPDTRERFSQETRADLLMQHLHQAASEFDRMQRELENARNRLRDQRSQLDLEEKDAQREIDQELCILQGRANSLSRVSALEVLTDHGLLPNYAFPERGVRFYGAIYNPHQGAEQTHQTIEVVRPARAALQELAPANHFYTHSRRFDIQQIAIGNAQDPLIEAWAICGACGHMRLVAELHQPDAAPACPQCGHDHDATSQVDRGQQRSFIAFPRSQALSYMEHYDSLSGDRSEEREREFYQIIRSFDLTQDRPTGAVGDESLPFGIEYRASIILREANVGYGGEPGIVAFGADKLAPEDGFKVCLDCGVVLTPGMAPEPKIHRRSCSARRRVERRIQENRQGQSFRWESVYLYRELKSEAIRLLLPIADDADIDTLTACLYLGLRLRFEGDPAHSVVAPQMMPAGAIGLQRYYLVLLDAVPGGTGYLKTLYQEKDHLGREGEGVMQVLRLAKRALETCGCRHLGPDLYLQGSDGCYRCIRSYHLQYRAERISRERGITLLGQLIEAGERRESQRELDSIKPNTLFSSMLEKKFVDALQSFVQERSGTWEPTLIRGNQGFRFALPGADRLWELEMQPRLGPTQGVAVPSQPDFLLRCDEARIKPIAIFTDGFQFHCHPVNRLADDMQKRRAILTSGQYHVWNITWDDLDSPKADHVMVCHEPIAQMLQRRAQAARSQGQVVPAARRMLCNGMEQLQAFIEVPHAPGWKQLAGFTVYYPLQMLASQRTVEAQVLRAALDIWRSGQAMPALSAVDGSDWVYNDKAALNQDVVTYIMADDAVSNRQGQTIVLARLGDSEAECLGSDYRERWRRFLSVLNVLQFCENFCFWSSSEADLDAAPDIPLEAATALDEAWQAVLDEVIPSLQPYILDLATAGLPVPESLPEVEHFNDHIDDDAFAELAWPQCQPPVCILAGDQIDFSARWQAQGWWVITPDDLQARGMQPLIDQLANGLRGG